MATKLINFIGPGGGLKSSFGTCTVGDTVQSRLTRVEGVVLTYSDARGDNTHSSVTSVNATPGSFVTAGQAGATLFWWAFGY